MRPLRLLGRAVLFVLHLAALVTLLASVVLVGSGCTHAHRTTDGGGEMHPARHPAEAFYCADCHLPRERCRCACWSGATTAQDCVDE